MKIQKFVFPILLAVLAFGTLTSNAYGATKIAPTEGEVGHPFTIIDTPNKRLIDGSVAVFRLGGLEVVVPARTHKPYNTMQGRLPLDMYSGVYEVVVRRPDGTEFEIGLFTVYGQTAPPPSIVPDIGAPGDGFTIADPLARIRTGDLALFYAEGTDPAVSGVPADNVVVSGDGMTLNGDVPDAAAQGVQNFVSVRPTSTADSRFGDLGFYVTVIAEPSISPTSGPINTLVTITDPLGRLTGADRIVFTVPGSPFDTGIPADAFEFVSPFEVRGTVPVVNEVPHDVTVHAGDPGLNDPLIEVQSFTVTLGGSGSLISPTSGPVNTLVTITDPLGRLTGADRIVFTVPGSPFDTGIPADAFEFVSPFEVRGRVPNLDAGLTFDVTVHPGDATFNDPLIEVLSFQVT